MLFKYLCVVHHDMRCLHNVGVGAGNKKKAEEYFGSATPGQKNETTKSKTKKNLGIGSLYFAFSFNITQACLKIWARQK